MGDSNDNYYKSIYDEVGRNFRHFLAWRRFIFAGYFAIIAVLFKAFDWKYHIAHKNSILLFVAIILSMVFWALDVRNRRLIQHISIAGAVLEKEMGLKNAGSYGNYQNDKEKNKPWLTHSRILGLFYGIMIFVFAVWFVIIFKI